MILMYENLLVISEYYFTGSAPKQQESVMVLHGKLAVQGPTHYKATSAIFYSTAYAQLNTTTCILTFSLPSKNLSSVQRTNYPIQSWLLFHHHNHHIPSHVHHLPRLSPLMYLISNHPHSTNQHNNPPNSVNRSQD